MRAESYSISTYSFGMIEPGRNFTTNIYRYGFNGKEKDDEMKGSGNSYDYGFRMYDPRVSRFMSTDPLFREFPELSTYQFASNTPIWSIDVDGLEKVIYIINLDPDKITRTKIVLDTPGKLGNGVAVVMNTCHNNKGNTSYFYAEKDLGNLGDLLDSYEKKKLYVYHGEKDKPGVLTVGKGHQVKKNEKDYFTLGCTIENAECEEIFKKDVVEHTAKAQEQLGATWEHLSQCQKDALTDIGFNKGPKWLKEFDIDNGSSFMFSFYERHKIDRDLAILKRRIGEYLLFDEGLYYHFDILKGKANVNIIDNLVKKLSVNQISGTVSTSTQDTGPDNGSHVNPRFLGQGSYPNSGAKSSNGKQ